MLTSNDLADIYSLFVYGVPVGALLSGMVWAVAYGIDLLKRIFMSS